ncbi:MAG TPA: 4'-phosphopantetheinyl transferase superfamily protein [Burkholderiales bacterium]|nr:4'-phosphopantetheinyl transferase superfamily protein [Burkholderiales bacterium]
MAPIEHSTASPPGRDGDWLPAVDRIELKSDEVHVWRVDVGERAAIGAGALVTLSEAERARAARFHFEADRRRFVAAHVALRGILASYLGAQPSSLVFGEGSHGKPFVAAPEHGRSLRFSLSHSGEVALVAVSLGREVGVDVERVRPREDLAGFVARYFSPLERQALQRLLSVDRLRAFFETWTLKEAYLKACGEGLLRELDAFDVTVGDAQPRLLAVRDRPGDEARWTLRRLDPGEGHVGALAVEGSDWQLRDQTGSCVKGTWAAGSRTQYRSREAG